jgi:hypothetical protein
LGGFSSIGAEPPDVIVFTGIAGGSTTSSTPVLLFSRTITLKAKSHIIIMVVPVDVLAGGSGTSFGMKINLDGADLNTFGVSGGTGYIYPTTLSSVALNIGAGNHTINFYYWGSGSLKTQVDGPITLIVLAIPA